MQLRMFCASIAIASATASLAGCGARDEQSSAPPRTPTVIDPLLDQRDRAKEQAEAAVEQRRQQLDAVESQER